MRILRLTLKRKWFLMILSGEKKSEYRELKGYWFRRLVFKSKAVLDYVGVRDGRNEEDIKRLCQDSFWSKTFGFIPFDAVQFTNGYAKNSPSFLIECKGIEIGTGNHEWGAEEGVEYFVIKLGEKLK